MTSFSFKVDRKGVFYCLRLPSVFLLTQRLRSFTLSMQIFVTHHRDVSQGGLVPCRKSSVVAKLLAAKDACGKTYDQLADELGLADVAQLFRRQAQLKKSTEDKLVKLVPTLTEELLREMRKAPLRSSIRRFSKSRMSIA